MAMAYNTEPHSLCALGHFYNASVFNLCSGMGALCP